VNRTAPESHDPFSRVPSWALASASAQVVAVQVSLTHSVQVASNVSLISLAVGQVLTLLDNFDGDALGTWRTAGRVRSTWARSSSSRIARS
jgi:hypothetical protein